MFSCDGSKLALVLGFNTVRVWDVITGEVKHTLKGYLGKVNSVVFSPDKSKLASRLRGGFGS